MNRTTYKVNEVFVDPQTAAAIFAAHQAEMVRADIRTRLMLMGLDGPGLIARYGGKHEKEVQLEEVS